MALTEGSLHVRYSPPRACLEEAGSEHSSRTSRKGSSQSESIEEERHHPSEAQKKGGKGGDGFKSPEAMTGTG